MNSKDAAVRARHSDIPQDALFDIDPPQSSGERPRARTLKRVGVGPCPVCKADEISHVMSNGQVVYRAHWRRTIKGAAMLCGGSGAGVADDV